MVLLVLILVGAGTVLERATRVAPAGVRSQQKAQLMSRDVLEAAKQALIAYAVMDDNRPGTLPCPDYDNDGLYQPGVDTLGSNCASPIGWLPVRNLGLGSAYDASGERLWYALTPAFSADQLPPHNYDTPAQLTVLGNAQPINDVVAVIFAPGPVVETSSTNQQNRPKPFERLPAATLDTINSRTVAQLFLEDENADNDNDFSVRQLTAVPAGEEPGFNDALVYITRDELLAAVGKRVLAELGTMFRRWHQVYGEFPHLSSYSDPNGSGFVASPGQTWGHLGFTTAGSVGNGVPEESSYQFLTHIDEVSWQIAAGETNFVPVVQDEALNTTPGSAVYLDPAVTDPVQVVRDQIEVAMRDSMLQASDAALSTTPAGWQAQCTWTSGTEVDCRFPTISGVSTDVIAYCIGAPPADTCASAPVTRSFELHLKFAGTATWDTATPTRSVLLTNAPVGLAGVQGFIEVEDAIEPQPGQRLHSRLRAELPSTVVALSMFVSGIYVEPRAVDPADYDATKQAKYGPMRMLPPPAVQNEGSMLEMPGWIAASQWQKFVLVSYSATPPCTLVPDCLGLATHQYGLVHGRSDLQAVFVLAGPPLTGQNRTASGDRDQYFEGSNETSTTSFERSLTGQLPGPTPINDQTYVLRSCEFPPSVCP